MSGKDLKNDKIPQSVENIILHACAKNPKNRYDSVNEMYKELSECLDPLNMDVDRLVYKYSEHNLEATKKLSKLETREIKNKALEIESEEEIEKDDKKVNNALKIVAIAAVSIVFIGLLFILIFSSGKTKEVKVPKGF